VTHRDLEDELENGDFPTEPTGEALTPIESQVLNRLRNGEPHRLPPHRVKAVFISLARKGYSEDLEL
jgi:hypothetical protein